MKSVEERKSHMLWPDIRDSCMRSQATLPLRTAGKCLV